MLIQHLIDENIWLITLGETVLYRGESKPWESITLWNEILERKWSLEDA